MTSDKKRKRAVRARAERTDMSYAAVVNAETPAKPVASPYRVPAAQEIADNDLVIVVRAAKPNKDGLGAEYRAVPSPQVFMGGRQIGFLQRVHFQATSGALPSQLGMTFPVESDLPEDTRMQVQATIDQLRSAFPWGTIDRQPLVSIVPETQTVTFEDIHELLSAIVAKLATIRTEPLVVLPADDPRLLLIGWAFDDDAGRTHCFNIRITNLRRSWDRLPKQMRQAFGTVEGRHQIAQALAKRASLARLGTLPIVDTFIKGPAPIDLEFLPHDWNEVNLVELGAELRARLEKLPLADREQLAPRLSLLQAALLQALRDLPAVDKQRRGAEINQFVHDLRQL